LIPGADPSPPETIIVAGPPEGEATLYSVSFEWDGEDDDGFVSHYEISWESPDDWSAPVFVTDSTFAVAAGDSCCVDPLKPKPDLQDSVYQQWHTLFVRAVDDDELPEPTPACRSFNAKTIAPYTWILSGPVTGQFWSPDVKFTWIGHDDDGVVEQYRYTVSSVREYRLDGQIDQGIVSEYIAWIDTLTYRPLPGGARGPNPWTTTTTDSIELLIPEETTEGLPVIFAVRSIDNAGAEERRLDQHDGPWDGRGGNVSIFDVRTGLAGPRISLSSNVAGTKRSGEAEDVREVFAGQGLRFEWTAWPGPSQSAVAGYSYAVDDTSAWTPYSLDDREFPAPGAGEEYWLPEAGDHTFFVRAIDASGFSNVLSMSLKILESPAQCDESDRHILVVLDTDADQLKQTLNLPSAYEAAERGLVEFLFDGYRVFLYETGGQDEPDPGVLGCASSVFWFMTSDVDAGDGSVLHGYHIDPPNLLASYVRAGGNLFLCGVQPSNAMKYFDDPRSAIPIPQSYPVVFSNTLGDETWVPHWCATTLRIDRVQQTVPSTLNATGSLAEKRLRKALAQVEGYPDLDFDTLSWPQGPIERGCGLYDRGIVAMADAEILYTANDLVGPPIAIRHQVGPGLNGNVVFLGFHPYFFERPQLRELIRAVLDDFGEVPEGPLALSSPKTSAE
jgi:hypothetical protein